MRKLEKKYQNLDEMKADGWTDKEIEALVNGPRTQEASLSEDHMKFVWPKIDGQPVCGTSLLNKVEKEMYYVYKKARKAANPEPRTSKPIENKEMWDALIEKCQGDAEALALVLQLMPQRKNSTVEKLFGESNPRDKVSLAWIMYRKSDGTRFTNRTGNIAEFVKEDDGIQCVYTAAQVTELVEKAEKSGVEVKKLIA